MLWAGGPGRALLARLPARLSRGTLRLVIEGGRRRFRRRAELALQNIGALPIVPDRRVVRLPIEVEPDQAAMDVLRQRIERQGAREGGSGTIAIAGRRLLLCERRQHADRLVMQARALDNEPFLEPGIAQPETFEQRSPIEVCGLAQLGDAVAVRGATKFDDVGLHDVRVQRDSFPFHRENRPDIKGGPDRGERLAEAVTGLLIAAISPQQSDQAFPQLCFADPAGQRRQQRFGLARGQSYRAALRPLRFEAAEQSEMNPARHHDLRSATSAIKDDNAILPREGPLDVKSFTRRRRLRKCHNRPAEAMRTSEAAASI